MDEFHLVFMQRGVRYAVHADCVQEIAWLPELSPVADGSPRVVGAFNLRGHVVPVLDLSLCFGHGRSELRASDAVIVVAADGERFAIVASEMLDATPIARAAIEDVHDHHELLGSAAVLLDGIAMRGEELVMVLDVRALLASAAHAASDHEGPAPGLPAEADGAGPARPDAELFRARARALAREEDEAGASGQERFALVRVDAELLGIPLGAVRECMRLRSVWPVPCCPPHIVGNMNLRGDILTLVDLRPVLGIPAAAPLAEVVVVREGELTVGVAVTEVMDIVDAQSIATLPSSADRELPHCRGAARSGDRVFSIVDIGTMLGSRVLHVARELGWDRSRSANRVLHARGT